MFRDRLAIVLTSLHLAAACAAAAPAFSDANWVSMNPSIRGASHTVMATAVDSSGNLYISGWFTAAGEIPANRIAKWDGTNWSALGSGIVGGNYPVIQALVLSGSNVYAGGLFTTAGGSPAKNIAKWDGTRWSALGPGIDFVKALAVSGSDLYVASYDNYVTKWNGTNWTILGQINGRVEALAVVGNDLYAGGEFTSAATIPANNIAKWNGHNWSAVGDGVEGGFGAEAPHPIVYVLTASRGDLYAGGNFTTAGGTPANHIAKWDGTNWSALGTGMGLSIPYAYEGASPRVMALGVSGSNVYASGYFTTAGGSPADGIAKWNGSSWSTLGAGLVGGITLAASGSNVYAGGGSFGTAGGVLVNHIAKWDGTNWSALGISASGITFDRYGNALAVLGRNVYRTCWIAMPDGSTDSADIAKWDGSGWSLLGLRMANLRGYSSAVYDLLASGNDLYAGGSFTNAGDVTANNVAKWNGTNWSALGSGVADNSDVPARVFALARSGSDLYVAGSFMMAGGIPANRVAKWDGTNWSALGSGIGGGNYIGVYALAVSGSNVYVEASSQMQVGSQPIILPGGTEGNGQRSDRA